MGLLCHQLLQAAVLKLQLLETLGLVNPKTAIFLAPAVICLLTEAKLLNYPSDRLTA